MFPLISFLFIKKMFDEAEEYKKEIRENLDKINKLDESIFRKGYDKLEQWRRGQIDHIYYNDVDIINWNIYCREKSEKQFKKWKKENPNYFEEERKRLEKWEKEYTKDMSEKDLMMYNLLKGLY